MVAKLCVKTHRVREGLEAGSRFLGQGVSGSCGVGNSPEVWHGVVLIFSRVSKKVSLMLCGNGFEGFELIEGEPSGSQGGGLGFLKW